MSHGRVIVVGGGVFGTSAALTLRSRGCEVSLFDPGPIPHPLAASTDISKVIRMEYGSDRGYMALAESAREGWLEWNAEWAAEGVGPLFHETGVLMICRDSMAPGGFEHDSFQLLGERDHAPERLDREEIAVRFPAWSTGQFVDGFFHSKGGYAESSRVIERLVLKAGREGVELRSDRRVVELIDDGGRVVGVRDSGGSETRGDHVVIAAGVWTGTLVPELASSIKPTGHPVFHLQPKDSTRFEAVRFPTFTADIARTGYYGFPLSRDGIVKVAHHGSGTNLDPDEPRAVTAREEEHLRSFLAESFPGLVDAPVVYSRLCLYADTQDEDFWIARHPGREGLTVATGGSGHGFKFAPVLGPIIADAVEGTANPLLERFRWRPEVRLEHGTEAARHRDERT